MKPWKVLGSDIVYENQHFVIRKDDVEKSDGSKNEYFTMVKEDTAVIAGFTPEKKLVMIRQYRHPVEMIDIEIPAGYLNKGEDPEDAARREFLEETGYQITELKKLGRAFNSAGMQNNAAYFYVAFDAVKVQDQNLDDNEDIEVFEATIEEALQFVKDGKMMDLGCVYGLMLAVKEIS